VQSVVTDLKGDVRRIGGDEVEKVFVLDERALLHDLYILRNKVRVSRKRAPKYETEQGRAYRVWLAQCVDSLQQEVAYLGHGLEAGGEEEKNASPSITRSVSLVGWRVRSKIVTLTRRLSRCDAISLNATTWLWSADAAYSIFSLSLVR
jgi:hypothetical protein